MRHVGPSPPRCLEGRFSLLSAYEVSRRRQTLAMGTILSADLLFVFAVISYDLGQVNWFSRRYAHL